jgi:hypothetical protein
LFTSFTLHFWLHVYNLFVLDRATITGNRFFPILKSGKSRCPIKKQSYIYRLATQTTQHAAICQGFRASEGSYETVLLLVEEKIQQEAL